MASKRALIVDDSRSARFVLKRMLKDLDLEVDTVESAIDAIDYLNHHRPDVIFMDHMMPGMNGFEAVKHIKNNSKTAVIPIMMYTTRCGDVYLSQARALGAVDIIPKTISPVDLKDSLLKLGLIEDIPIKSSLVLDGSVTGQTNDNEIIDELLEKQEVLDTYINKLGRLMDEQTIELHKSMWLGIESVSYEIFNRLNHELEHHLDKIHSTPQEIPAEPVPAEKNKISWLVYVLGFLLLISMILNVVLLTETNQVKNDLVDNSEDKVILPDESKTIEKIIVSNKDKRLEFIKNTQDRSIEYPFDELALNDSRLHIIEELVKQALDADFTGSIVLQTHVGRFCLSSDDDGKYKLADNKLPVTECELIGNYIQPNDEPSTHQSLSFANYLSDLNLLNEKGIVIEITNVARKLELSPYPEQVSNTTAEKWNLAAQLNNRITINLIAD